MRLQAKEREDDGSVHQPQYSSRAISSSSGPVTYGETESLPIGQETTPSLADDLPRAEDEQERERKVEQVRPFWEESLSKHERYSFLKVPVVELQRAAKRDSNELLSEGETMEGIVNVGLRRMCESGALKRWTCVLCGDRAGQFQAQQQFKEHLRSHLSRETGVESFPAEDRQPTDEEKNFRTRMGNLHEEVRDMGQRVELDNRASKYNRLPLESHNDASNRAKIEAVAYALEQLAYEDVGLDMQVEEPLTDLAIELLVPGQRYTRENAFDPHDLFQLETEDIGAAFEIVTDRVQELSMERLDSSVTNQEHMDDVDLFELDDNAAAAHDDCGIGFLQVNSKWISHLEQRRMDSNGKIEPIDDHGTECPKGGLILDWIFGKIVNTAEKSRSGVQTNVMGQQLPGTRLQNEARKSYWQLCELTREMSSLEQWYDDAREGLRGLLEAKKREDAEEEHAAQKRAQEILAVLGARKQRDRRKELVTYRKRLRSEWHRLKREVEELDRQRSSDKRSAQQLQQQRQDVAQRCAAKERAMQEVSSQYEQAVKAEEQIKHMYNHGTFSNESSQTVISNLRQKINECYDELERYRISFGHMEFKVINLCCSDPGMHINMRLARPLLQRGIEHEANRRAEEQARRAEEEILAELEKESNSSSMQQQHDGKRRARKRSKRQRSNNVQANAEHSAGAYTAADEANEESKEKHFQRQESSEDDDSPRFEDASMESAKRDSSADSFSNAESSHATGSFEDDKAKVMYGQYQSEEKNGKAGRGRKNRKSKSTAYEGVEGALFADDSDVRGAGKAATISELRRASTIDDTSMAEDTAQVSIASSKGTSRTYATGENDRGIGVYIDSVQDKCLSQTIDDTAAMKNKGKAKMDGKRVDALEQSKGKGKAKVAQQECGLADSTIDVNGEIDEDDFIEEEAALAATAASVTPGYHGVREKLILGGNSTSSVKSEQDHTEEIGSEGWQEVKHSRRSGNGSGKRAVGAAAA